MNKDNFKKVPLVLLPGLLSDASVWQHQAAGLESEAAVVIPDLSQPDTPDKMVAAVLAVAPPRFVLAGHSMGGWVALEIMKRVPECVIALGLINTTARPDPAEKKANRAKLIEMAEQGEYSQIVETLLNVFVHQPACVEDVRSMLLRNCSAFINQEKAMLAQTGTLDVLSQITCPTLIIQGENDLVFTMEDANVMHHGIKGSTLSVIPECGHFSPIEAADVVTQLLKELINKS